MSSGFLLALLFVVFAAVSFFTMLHLMGSGHTRHARALRSVHRISELLAILVFAVVVIGEVIDLIDSGFSARGGILLSLAAVLIPLFIVKNLISEKYPELRNRLISLGTTVLVIVFVFTAASAIFYYVETREEAAGASGRAAPAVDLDRARELFVAKCSKCHRLDAALSESRSPEEWHATVEAMRQKDLTWIGSDEAGAIAEFLIYVGAAGQ